MIIQLLTISILIITGYTDIKYKRISNKVLFLFGTAAIVLFIGRCYFREMEMIKEMLWGLLPGISALLIGKITKENIGFGDGYLLLILGVLLGAKRIIGIFMIALFLMSILSILLLMIRRVNKQTELPFIPAILIAYVVQLIAG